MNLEKHKLVISNAFSLTMLQHFDAAKVLVRRVSLDEVRREIERAKQSGYEIVSAIGHESTARLVSQLLGFDLPMNRIQVSLDYRTELSVFQLRTRLPEGKILSEEELKQVEYDFYIVSLEPLRTEGEEEVKKTDNTKTKRKKILPRELRIKIYNDVRKLRKRGLSYTKIREEIHRKYGVWIGKSTIVRWSHGESSPYNGRRIPSLELLKPSEDLAYIIGMRLGDGSAWEKLCGYKGYRQAGISLKAKDKEFVEESAIRVARVLGCRPPKIYFNARTGEYVFIINSKTLYELLKKPINIKKLRRYIEHCPKCMAAFLRGFFDSEGSVRDDGVITVGNSNYRLLKYVQKLLRKFGIAAKGPELVHRQGSIMSIEGRKQRRRRNVYRIYIRPRDAIKFYRWIGFTIRRKQKHLEEYLKRTGKI
jgi:intein-encoded DNA endonuclease-like protein